jgi:hypothetical protein
MVTNTNSFDTGSSVDSLNPSPYSANRAKIPFISQVSNFVSRCSELKNYKSKLEDETKRLELQIRQMNDSLGKTIKKESRVMQYLSWFYKLKTRVMEQPFHQDRGNTKVCQGPQRL